MQLQKVHYLLEETLLASFVNKLNMNDAKSETSMNRDWSDRQSNDRYINNLKDEFKNRRRYSDTI